MRVPLPDGSVRELPDGSTGADLAADIGPGLARAAMAIRVLDGDRTEKRDGTAYDDGRIRDLSLPLVDGEAVEIVTAKAGDGDALKLLRHDVAHVLAESVLELYPGTKVSIGPPIADGFYYDFEFPDGVSINEGDFERIEAQMRKHIKAGEPFERSEVAAGEAIERYLKEDQPYKVELIEDLVKNQRRGDRQPVSQRRVPRPLPRAARARHRPREGVQADVSRRRLLARRRQPPDADPDLRHRVRDQGGARRAPRAARAGARPRPPQAGPRARAVHVLRLLAGLAVLVPERDGDLERADRAVAGRELGARLPRGPHADPLQRRDLQAVRALARVPGQHVLHGRRGRVDGPQAHELPGAHAALRVFATVVPRPADPLLRAGPRAPPRAVRHAARPAARPPHHAGRRAHLRHRGPDRGRGHPLPRLRVRDLRAVRVRAAAGALHAAREADRLRGHVGPRRGGAPASAGEPRPRVRVQRGRRRVLRAEDRPPHDRRDRPLMAARAPSSSTT